MSNSIHSITNQSSNGICTCNVDNVNLSKFRNSNFDVVLSNESNKSSYSEVMYGVSNIPTGILSSSNASNNILNNLFIQNENSVLDTNRIEVINSDNLTETQKIEDAVKRASKKYGVDEKLIKAVIKTESNFKTNAVSSAGAKGLMQIMPSNYKNLGITDPFDVYQNIDGGTKLLKEYMNKYGGDVEMALMAYNGGPTRMKNRGVTSIEHIYKMPKETRNYVKKVMKYYMEV